MTPPSIDEEIAALRAALYVTAIPSRRQQLRNEPLSAGVGLLLRIVANECGAIDFYAARTEKPPEELREAAAFYLEQAMFASHADSYRVLGTTRYAPAAELRRNLVLLCRWLHSDMCEDWRRSVFLLRVTQAWNDLKTPERRAAYDALLDARTAPAAVSCIPRMSVGGKSAKAGAKKSSSQRERLRERTEKEQTMSLRKSHPKGLWRLMTFGRDRRVR